MSAFLTLEKKDSMTGSTANRGGGETFLEQGTTSRDISFPEAREHENAGKMKKFCRHGCLCHKIKPMQKIFP